jgi:hypothetical protein
MLSSLEANGVIWITQSQIGDLMDIDRRAKFGDESGWRGDPSFCVCINNDPASGNFGWFEVWGTDARGEHYKAASNPKLGIELIHQLRNGDPQKHDVFSEVMARNARLVADKKAADRDRLGEIAEHMQWAIRRDFHTELGTSSKADVHAIPRKVGA